MQSIDKFAHQLSSFPCLNLITNDILRDDFKKKLEMSPRKDSLNGLPEESQIGHTVTSRKLGLSQKKTWKGALKSPDRNSKGRPGRFQELGCCKNRLEGAPLKI